MGGLCSSVAHPYLSGATKAAVGVHFAVGLPVGREASGTEDAVTGLP